MLPDCNVIFLFDRRRWSLIAYDMDHGTTRVVHSFMDATASKYQFFPYVPLYLQIAISIVYQGCLGDIVMLMNV